MTINRINSPEWVAARYTNASGGLNYTRIQQDILKKIANNSKAVEVTISAEAASLALGLEAANNMDGAFDKDVK